jgi:hypothetical protein
VDAPLCGGVDIRARWLTSDTRFGYDPLSPTLAQPGGLIL